MSPSHVRKTANKRSLASPSAAAMAARTCGNTPAPSFFNSRPAGSRTTKRWCAAAAISGAAVAAGTGAAAAGVSAANRSFKYAAACSRWATKCHMASGSSGWPSVFQYPSSRAGVSFAAGTVFLSAASVCLSKSSRVRPSRTWSNRPSPP